MGEYLKLENDKLIYVDKVLNNARGDNYLWRHMHSNKYSVTECYKIYPSRKLYIERYIIEHMLDVDGYGYKVLSYNNNYFSCGYYVNGVLDNDYLIIHTYANKYAVPVPKNKNVYND